MLKLILRNTTKPLPKGVDDPLPIAELSLSIDPPIPKSGQCEGYPFLRVELTAWSDTGDSTTCDLSFPLLGPGWPEVTATLTKDGQQDPNLFLKLPTGHTLTVPSEIKGGLEVEGLPPLSPPGPECSGN